MDADGQTLLRLVTEMRAQQNRFHTCGGDRDMFAMKYAERQVDQWIEALQRRGEAIEKCEHGIDPREHCARCNSLRTRQKRKMN